LVRWGHRFKSGQELQFPGPGISWVRLHVSWWCQGGLCLSIQSL